VPDRDWLALKVKEAKGYELVYDLDLARLGPEIRYNVDRSGSFTGGFDRVAYFLELQKSGGSLDYMYVSMDAFTDDVKKVGIPALASGAVFQVDVKRLNVMSNVRGIEVGEGLDGGNIEFWPNNYGQNNAMSVPNASSGAYDFGDEMAFPPEGYGCMQVHNHAARQTLFAINQWRSGGGADLGIGNRGEEAPDWTFAGNASQYDVKRLRVLVRRK
jgi:sialate O-acetylesterase